MERCQARPQAFGQRKGLNLTAIRDLVLDQFPDEIDSFPVGAPDGHQKTRKLILRKNFEQSGSNSYSVLYENLAVLVGGN